MAARAIAEGDDAVVMSRLRLIAHHPHWRNTWLLAAGELLLRSERFEKRILDLLKQLDSDPHRLNARYPAAPALAADVLDDNLAAKRPRFERGLIERLLSVLDRPPVVDVPRLATTLLRIASTDTYRRLVYDRISSAASAGAARRAASALVLEEMAMEVPSHDARLTSMLNAYRALAIPETEVQAIGAWQGMSTRSIPLRAPMVRKPISVCWVTSLSSMVQTRRPSRCLPTSRNSWNLSASATRIYKSYEAASRRCRTLASVSPALRLEPPFLSSYTADRRNLLCRPFRTRMSQPHSTSPSALCHPRTGLSKPCSVPPSNPARTGNLSDPHFCSPSPRTTPQTTTTPTDPPFKAVATARHQPGTSTAPVAVVLKLGVQSSRPFLHSGSPASGAESEQEQGAAGRPGGRDTPSRLP